MQPTEIRLTRQRDALEIDWEDGSASRLAAVFLRENSQSAESKRLRADGWDVPPPPSLTIAEIRPVGHYAINLVFSDGHDRGIYPWSYLRALATGEPGDGN